MKQFKNALNRIKIINKTVLVIAGIIAVTGLIVLLTPVNILAQEGGQVGSKLTNQATGWAFLAAGLSISVAVLGAGMALSKIGSAAVAALAEKPEIMGGAIVFAGLAEGLSIWGLIVAVLILGKI